MGMRLPSPVETGIMIRAQMQLFLIKVLHKKGIISVLRTQRLPPANNFGRLRTLFAPFILMACHRALNYMYILEDWKCNEEWYVVIDLFFGLF